MELLVEKVLSSSGQLLSLGDALRRVFEAIASGILLPGKTFFFPVLPFERGFPWRSRKVYNEFGKERKNLKSTFKQPLFISL